MVTVVGCVARATDGRSLLASASIPKLSTVLHADQGEIQAASSAEPGRGVFERGLFNGPETANGSGALRPGRKVTVKALLIADGVRPALNLLSVQPVAETCTR
jgi:hypothetical protein